MNVDEAESQPKRVSDYSITVDFSIVDEEEREASDYVLILGL
jgi:hypothetical protein